MGEEGDGRSDPPMDVAMKMVTAATPITKETTGASIVEPMEGNKNGKWRSSSDALATALDPSDWRNCMERTVQEQAQELMQLHRTVGHLTDVLDAQAARIEAQQWRGMLTRMQEREQNLWDARHEDNNR